MWGNKLAWALSVLVIALIGTMLWTKWPAGSPITPAATPLVNTVAAIDPIQLPIDPETLMSMNDPCDAGEYYRQAIAEFYKNRSDFRYFKNHLNDRHSGAALPAVELLVRGAHCQKMTLYLHPEEVANYGFDRAELEDVNIMAELAEVAFKQGLINKAGDPLQDGAKKRAAPDLVEAKRLYEAGFAVGVHMYHERVLFKELQESLDLLREGADALKSLADALHDQATADKCSAFRQSLINYQSGTIEPTWNFIRRLDEANVAAHMSDVLYLAQHAKDRMWRIEAILTLGQYQFDAPAAHALSAGNRAVPEILRNLAATATDPAVHAAAVEARDLTEENSRMIQGRGL